MSSAWGTNIRISLFGESHGPAVGVVMDGLPPGIPLDGEALCRFMARRAPGGSPLATARREGDIPAIKSGVLNGVTTGTPLCAVIENGDTRSGDYGAMRTKARPGHADYTGFVRYSGRNDPRGGGHFSGRLTAPLVFAGAVAVQALAVHGIAIGGHVASVGGIEDHAPDSLALLPEDLRAVARKELAVFDDGQGALMRKEVEAAKTALDSVGGIVQCFGLGVPAGLGSPMFGGVENKIASLLFGVPAVKGVEFGAGFGSSRLRGSENNDAMAMRHGIVVTKTNNHGGILGGITSGMPLVVRAAFKPTPSIGIRQETVDFAENRDTELAVEGRHDPCIVPRAVPCVEACVALAVFDILMERGGYHQWA